MVSFLALGIIYFDASRGLPWSMWKIFDLQIFDVIPNFSKDFYLGEGIFSLFALPYVVYVLITSKSLRLLFLGVWFFLPYILIPIHSILGISLYSVVFVLNYIPTGIFIALECKLLSRYLSKKVLMLVGPFVFFVIFMNVTYPAIKVHFSELEFYYSNNSRCSYYQPPGFFELVPYIKQHTAPYSVFLSSIPMGMVLPAYAPVRSWVAHGAFTQNYYAKQESMHTFFRGSLSYDDAYNFLHDNNIQYVFFSICEYEGIDMSQYNNLLQPWYLNQDIAVYKVL